MRNAFQKITLFHVMPMITVMGMIFWLSHQPGDHFDYDLPLHADKAAHAVMYGLLAAACLFAMRPFGGRKRPCRSAVLAVAVCLLYGVSDELHQLLIPHRDASLADLLADLVGSTTVAAFWCRTRRQKAL